jgi:hypothetical protein
MDDDRKFNPSRFRSAWAAAVLFYGLTAGALDFKGPAWRDMRLLGRGDAGLATIAGGNAAFYNPAGLAWSDVYSFTLLNPYSGTNTNVIGSYANILGIASGSNSGQTLSQKFAPFLGKPLALQAGIFPQISMPHFMVGFFDVLDSDIAYHDPVNPTLDVDFRNDWGIIAGAGWNYQEYFSVGFSLRWINRSQLYDVLDTSTLLTATTDYLVQHMRKGDAYGFNVGFQGRLPMGKNKLFGGFVVEDVGYTTFRSSDLSKPLPLRQPMRMNAGIAYEFGAVPGSTTTFYFDAKDLNDFDLSWSKKIYTGIEIATRIADFRAGLFQGYWTAGTSIAVLPFLLIDVTTYGRELDSVAGMREERYYMLGVRMGLDLKKSAKKKQRFTLDNL